MVKDESENKDYNSLAHQDMKLAKYWFAYLRTNEKLHNRELKRQQELKEQLAQEEEMKNMTEE